MQLPYSIGAQLPCGISVHLACNVSVHLACSVSVRLSCSVRNILYNYKGHLNHMYGCDCTHTRSGHGYERWYTNAYWSSCQMAVEFMA